MRIVPAGLGKTLCLAASVAVAASTGFASATAAQERMTVYAPGATRPSVVVDLSVLEKLGPEPTLVGLLRPGAPASPGMATPVADKLLPPPNAPPRSTLTLPPGMEPPQQERRVQTPASPPPSPARSATPAPQQATTQEPSVQPPRPQPAPPAPRVGSPPQVERPERAEAPPAVPPRPAAPREAAAPSAPAAAPPAPSPQPRVAPPPPPPSIAAPPPPPRPAAQPPQAAETPRPPAPAEAADTTPAPSAPAAMPAPTPSQTASLPPPQVQPGGGMQIVFAEDSAELPETAKAALADLVKRLQADPNLRVQLHGYASVKDDSVSQARRLSLFRALSVRTYLMNEQIRSTRIDVRALGSRDDGGPADRVDVVLPSS